MSTRAGYINIINNGREIVAPLLGGGSAGAMHAITGPDHLACLIVPCSNQGPYAGALIGAVWGLGHAIPTILLGMLLYVLKNQASSYGNTLDKISKYSSLLVGLNLVFIGVLGLKDSWKEDPESISLDNNDTKKGIPLSLVFGNGFLHGFSLDGVVSLVPSLTLSTAYAALLYLLSYAVSTAVVMSAAAAAISGSISKLWSNMGEGSKLPQKLAYYSSLVSIVLGLLWSSYAILGNTI